ncbi:unnamed protein product [Parnassius apollo]|uniref:(apollo) hypothetical protein n=1 Tax=Parnassius apollo TaxID=110799 RepID=A0A8S3XNT2_PARAO|nr:unnamed protein product [Parnassius apollo]
MVLNEDVKTKGDSFIFNNIRICDCHFEEFYRSASKRLTRNAVPTLNLSSTSPIVLQPSSSVETEMYIDMQIGDNLEPFKLPYPKQKLLPRGINETIMKQLAKTVKKLPDEKKLCTLIFDEVALTPGL